MNKKTLPPFVKKFDFRGLYNREIKDKDAYYLAFALTKTLDLKKVLVGWDTRRSSRALALNFIKALQSCGIEICYMDKCPIDFIASAAYEFDFDLSVMFTGSHNHWDWSGLLMHTKGGASVQGNLVNKIVENYYSSQEEEYQDGDPDLQKLKNFYADVEKIYEDKITQLIPVAQIRDMNVLVDIGDGSGSKSISLLEKLLPQVKFTRINDREIYDENSSHTADPSEIDNMQDLIKEVKAGNYSCGFAFDSDADRVLAVDENGDYINGSILGSAFINVFLGLNLPDKIFGYAVDCGPSMYNTVKEIGLGSEKEISIIPIPVGRSIMRGMIRENKLDLGVENVGHFYSKDFFMTDSGVFSIAVILYWMSKNGKLSNLKSKYPDGFRGQIFSPKSPENGLDSLRSEIDANFKNGESKEVNVDGERREFFENGLMSSWYTIRKSGYEKITKFYFGSVKESDFMFLKKKFDEFLNG